MNKKRFSILASGLSLLPLSLSAAVTYVDAVQGALGNTYATGGSLANTDWINFTDSAAEDQNDWRLRPGSSRGVGDTIFHARTNEVDPKVRPLRS